jgi:hypothetical protein
MCREPRSAKRAPRQAPPVKLADGSLVPLGDPLAEIAAHVDGTFVLVVRVTGGRYRRRCFLSVAAAERAAPNAQATGHSVEILLCELRPLRRLAGEVVAS